MVALKPSEACNLLCLQFTDGKGSQQHTIDKLLEQKNSCDQMVCNVI